MLDSLLLVNQNLKGKKSGDGGEGVCVLGGGGGGINDGLFLLMFMREVTKMIIIWTILKNVHEGGHQNDNNKWIYVPNPSVTIHARDNGD